VNVTATEAQLAPDPIGSLRRMAGLALPDGGRVLLAVSGGSDSVALLAAAHETLDHELSVVHVRHGLRPDDGQDALFVESLCRDLSVPCRVVHASPVGGAAHTETAARRRRLEVLERVARESGCAVVLVAHHVDDARETVLLHLLRGHRGNRALVGIPAVRRLGPECVLVRPFVSGPGAPDRDALVRLRTRSGLPCVVDPTNADTRIRRNAVRAWLASRDDDLGPRIDALRGAARHRLERCVLGAALALEAGMAADGLGLRVKREAFEPPGTREELREHRAELLRLLASALVRPRRADPRGSVLDALQRALALGQGRVHLPATPAALDLHCSRRYVHLLDEPPGEHSSASARILAAVSLGSLHV
jgi:tRNA(Ile)-lysidine synthase